MKKSFLLLLCLAAVSLSACKKHAPVASGKTCSDEYLISHPDLQKFFEANPDAWHSFRKSCDLAAERNFSKFFLETYLEKAKVDNEITQADDYLSAKAKPLATVETCQANYLQAHPDFLKNNLPINESFSNVINADDVNDAFRHACMYLASQLSNSIQAKVNSFATLETCQANYIQAHPDFLKNLKNNVGENLINLEVQYGDWSSQEDVFPDACHTFLENNDNKFSNEAQALATKETCSVDYLKSHPEFLKMHPELTASVSYKNDDFTYFTQGCHSNYPQIPLSRPQDPFVGLIGERDAILASMKFYGMSYEQAKKKFIADYRRSSPNWHPFQNLRDLDDWIKSHYPFKWFNAN